MNVMNTIESTLSIGEVAASFGWNPRFVERLAAGGKIPGIESGGQWRFRREELVDWLDQKLQTLEAPRIAELEFRLESELESDGSLPRVHPALLTSRLQLEGVELALPSDSKPAVLRALVDVAVRTRQVLDELHLHASLVEREGLCSTALPGGVAIIHPRRPAPSAVRQPLLCFGRTLAPIPFGAAGGQPTQMFFLLVSIEDRSHLHSLARLVRVLRGPTLAALRTAPDPAAVLEILRDREAEIDEARGDVTHGR